MKLFAKEKVTRREKISLMKCDCSRIFIRCAEINRNKYAESFNSHVFIRSFNCAGHSGFDYRQPGLFQRGNQRGVGRMFDNNALCQGDIAANLQRLEPAALEVMLNSAQISAR
ncbi:hypothetical protein [Serratia quinivorans]|uniref:hypothetical protein n=1 Tax=Serratia quinivorans TaxID=137545 RepID=UPI0034C6391C